MMTRKHKIYDAAFQYANEHWGSREQRIDAYIAGADWADEHPNWINIEDKLPPYGEMVLLYCNSWDNSHVCERAEGQDGDVYYNEEGRMLEDKPSYWMPRPKLPKKGGKQ